MSCYKCVNKFTGEIRILAEVRAFDLDNRQWNFQPWTATSGNDKPILASSPPATKFELQVMGHKCIYCESYIPHDMINCNRKKHVRFS